jgi:hypothetical protein
MLTKAEEFKAQEEVIKSIDKSQKAANDEALKLFRERWWDRFHKTRLYQWIHGALMGRAGEIVIVLRKDNKIALRPWCSKKADRNQIGAFNDIFNYIYFMSDNMIIVEGYHRNLVQLQDMAREYKEKHGADPVLDELFKTYTIQ